MTYAQRRRQSFVLYVLAALFLLPPGAFRMGVQAASRTATLSRLSALETFRNPQFSGGANRFLSGQSASAFVGGGGDSLSNPGARGYRRDNSPLGLWLPTGKLEWAEADLGLPGLGMPLVFQRMNRGSVTGYDGPLGEGWDFNWNTRLYENQGAGNDVLLHEMGRSETYNETTGTYATPAGRYDTLAKDTGPTPDLFTLTDKYGTVKTFEDEGSGWYRLTEIEDLNDNAIAFAYDTNGKLTKVTDTLAQDTILAYDTDGRITKITDPHSREWVYGYDSGALTSVRTPVVNEADNDHDFLSGKTRSYAYDASSRLTSVTRPQGHVLSVAYDGGGKITSQTVNGNAYTISYGTTGGGAAYVEVDDREGLADNRYYYDQTTDLITRREIEVTSGQDTTYAYNADAEVTLATFPNGNRLAYSYDTAGNVTQLQYQKDSSDTTSPMQWTWGYDGNNRLTSLTDPNSRTWTYARDTDGNLTRKTWPAVTVPSGIASTDSNGNSVNDGTIVEDYEYTAAGLLTKVTDPFGTDTAYEYSQVNSTDAYLQRVIRDPSGLALTTAYAVDGRGNVTSVTDPEGNTTTYSYNALDQVLVTAEPLGVTRTTYYDGDDRVTKTTVTNDTDVGDSLYTTNTLYDAYGNVTATIADVDGTSSRLTTTMAYDDNDWLTKRVSPGGVETRYVYDERGLRTSTIQELGATDAVSIAVYDDNGNRITSTDPLGNHTVSAYDKLDRVTRVTSPEGHYTTYAHDTAGNVTQVSRYNSSSTLLAQTTTSFDEANRVYKTERLAKQADLSTNLGDGLQTKTVWRDERGAVLEYTDDICGCSAFTYVYDDIGRRITTKDPMPGSQQNLTITAYDKNGRVTKTTRKEKTQDSGIEGHKDIVVESVYDARNRQVTRRDKRAPSTYSDTERFYGKRDQLTKVIDPDGDVTLYEYNEQLWRTEVTAETAGDDVITQFVHDDDGRVVTYRAKNSLTGDQETLYTYDAIGRRVTTEWPDTGTTIQTYDLAGQRVSTTDPIGTVAVRTYDDDRRLTAVALTLATNVKGVTSLGYGLDGLGRITSADTAEASGFTTVVDRTYNTLGKIETETQILDGYDSGNGRTVTYDWNVAGQKTGVTYPVSGDVIAYTRDDLDRVDAITREGSEVVNYAFNGSRVIEKAFPGSAAEMTYDGFGRLTQIHHLDSSSTNTLLQLDYGYDDSHRVTHLDKLFYDDVQNTRITAATEDLGDQYAYDGAGRLVSVLRGVPTAQIGTAMATNITNNDYDDKMVYHYDQTGNRMTRERDGTNVRTFTHGSANEILTENGIAQSYDANGNFEGASNAYKYNWQNQLETYTVGPATFTWHHDAFGRTVQQDRTTSTASARRYYDGVNTIEAVSYESTSGVETHQKTWVFGDRPDEMLMYIDVTASPDDEYYAHADRLGSVMLMVDDTGAIQESYRYTEWGEHTILDDTFTALSFGTGSPIANPYLYTGQRWARTAEGSTGGSGMTWFDYKARHYRADAGRFVQRDPAGYVDGGNGYYYSAGDPINHIDPTGLFQSAPPQDVPPVTTDPPFGGGGPASGIGPGSNGGRPKKKSAAYVQCYKECQDKRDLAKKNAYGFSDNCYAFFNYVLQDLFCGSYANNCPGGCDATCDKLADPKGTVPHPDNLADFESPCCQEQYQEAILDALSSPSTASLAEGCANDWVYWEGVICAVHCQDLL